MEESIRRKLVVDGEGMGDDRRIILLTKLLMKWASGQDAERYSLSFWFSGFLLQNRFSGERESTLKKIEVALSQTEFGMEKASRVHHMNEQQCVLYDQLAKKIGIFIRINFISDFYATQRIFSKVHCEFSKICSQNQSFDFVLWSGLQD